MNKEEYLKVVRKEIKYIFDRDAIEKELNEHIQDSILDLMSEGYSYEDAKIQAVSQMGDPKELGKQLNKEHHPLIGYLYSFTQVIIYLMIVPLLISSLSVLHNISGIMFEHKTDDYFNIIELDYKVEMAGHTFILDNVCIDKYYEATLNYRTFTNFFYSRSNWSVDIDPVYDLDDRFIDTSGYSSPGLFGRWCQISFELPYNEIFKIVLPDGQIITIDLGDYRK